MKKFAITLALIFSILPIYKIQAQTYNADTTDSKIYSSGLELIKNIGKLVEKNTPDFIAKPIIRVINKVEKLRLDMDLALKNKKQAAQSENKKIELFFFSLLSFVFNNKLIFYGVLIAVILMVLRYIWNLIL